MKKILFFTFAAITLSVGSFSAQAMCTGCTYVGPVDVDLDYLYHWEARVKYQVWYTNASRQHTMRWDYLTLSGTTQTYCQNQLSSVVASGATVVQYCTNTRN